MSEPWSLLAVRPEGTVASLATAPAAAGPSTVLAATAAGLRLSNDGGRTWTAPKANRQTPGIEVVAPSPGYAEDRTLFAGAPNGLFRSTDAGATWQLVLTGNRVLAAAVSPAFADDRLVFVGTESDGLLRSDDAGDTWSSANAGLNDLTVLAVACSPSFAADQTALAATASGLYRSRDGGTAWRQVDQPPGEVEVQCLAVSPAFAEDGLALAGTVEHGLFRSEDGGATWVAVTALASESVTALACSTRFATTRVVAAATGDGVMLSNDAGVTWRPVGADLGPVLSLTFADDGLIAGLPKLGARRVGAGGAWTDANDGLNANLIVGLALSPGFASDQTLYTASLEDGIAVSTDGGATWTARNDGLDDTAVFGLALSPRYAEDRTLYAATALGLYRSRDAAAAWQPALAEPELSAARYVATAAAGDTIHVLTAFQAGRLSLSADAGETWTVLPFDTGDEEVVAVAFSPRYDVDRTLFVGTGHARPGGDPSLVDLSLFRSTDGGQVWRRWLDSTGPNALPLAIPSTYSLTHELAFAGAGQRVLRPNPGAEEVRRGERRPIWRSAYLSGEPASVTALAISPDFRRARTVVAATGVGIHLSQDGGDSFALWSDGLPPAPIVAVALAPAYPDDPRVYAVGLGGTLWHRPVA